MIQLKISISGIDPPIWRRILVSPKTTLLDLHDIIQYSLGWKDSHLFIFQIGPMEFVNPLDWQEDSDNFQSAELGILGELIPKYIPEGESFTYIYDLGDYWVHHIFVEKVNLAKENIRVPICMSGNRACPPEDIGGSYGYQQLLNGIKYPELLHDVGLDYSDLSDFDPEEFNIESINKGLKDYIKVRNLQRLSSWKTRVDFYNPIDDFSSIWTKNITGDDLVYIKALPFRQDLVTMLKYLQNNKVKGTPALGNFPRKHIRAMTEGFINSPELDIKIGDRVFKLQTEDEVPDLVFMHTFANAIGLILGGENLNWDVSFLGEMFLEREPHQQVWFLTKFWLKWFDWYFCYQFDDILQMIDLHKFKIIVGKLFLNYQSNFPIDLEKIIMDINKSDPNWIVFKHDGLRNGKKFFLLDVVIKPFEKLGLIETQKRQYFDYEYFHMIEKVVVTDFGKSLLKNFV